MPYSSPVDMGVNHRQYRCLVSTPGLEFYATIEFRAEGSSVSETESDAAFQVFVDLIDASTEFEFAGPPDMNPPQKWSTFKSEVTPT